MGFDEQKAFTALKIIATGAAGMFAGGAAYINICEHPARMTLADTKMCHKQWKESFDRAKVYQARLALVTAASGLGAYYLKSSPKGIVNFISVMQQDCKSVRVVGFSFLCFFFITSSVLKQ